ncbi:putative aldehyde dehydrogenase AldA [Ceratocystis platani]|uniref:aldehyde dehydrogenase (NAD(+)) n=1 Tax=Ceratocystis fimbriata f. sp. platani TaxID=88771 RepID=A0A0F8B072_CERFI|nr:putative aldehyde dehydrogenase AldA [Ceratocystis platani]
MNPPSSDPLRNRAQLMWVGGKEIPGSGPVISVEDPSLGRPIDFVHSAGIAEVNMAVELGHAAYKGGAWSRASRHERARVFDNAATRLMGSIDIFTDIEVTQTGRPTREMTAQVPTLVKWFQYYAALLRTEERSVLPTTGSLHNWVDRVPLGVVALITPFNHPLLIAVKKLAPALAAGNSVVLKPSELAPVTSLLLGRVLRDAGIPDGVLSVIPGHGATTGQALVQHPLVRKVDITGGTMAGRSIGALIGGNLTPLTAELGGKAPMIVLENANIDAAVNGAVFGSFIASGQTCVAATRIIVQDSILDEFVQKLAIKVSTIVPRIGSPRNMKSMMGPVIGKEQLDRISNMVNNSVASGHAVVLCGGMRMTGKSMLDGSDLDSGYFYAPTVVASNPAHTQAVLNTRLWREEAFGPVVVVVGCKSEDEAISLANDSEYGLGAAVWTQDLSQAFRVTEQIEAGVVWVNTHHRNDPSSPWGGVKPGSGVGSENGKEAYYAYTRMKSTVMNYASAESMLATEDWFRDDAAPVRYG